MFRLEFFLAGGPGEQLRHVRFPLVCQGVLENCAKVFSTFVVREFFSWEAMMGSLPTFIIFFSTEWREVSCLRKLYVPRFMRNARIFALDFVAFGLVGGSWVFEQIKVDAWSGWPACPGCPGRPRWEGWAGIRGR